MIDQILSLPEMVEIVAGLRAQNKRIVLTNGTFDVLHVGHIRYLQAARKMGDVLIVALNSDTSVRGYKGPGRPIVPQDERAEIVAALRCVDYVTIFEEPTATHIVEALRPDVYVKGGDYDASTGKPLPEAQAVLAYGGEVRLIPYVAGHSASELIARINK